MRSVQSQRACAARALRQQAARGVPLRPSQSCHHTVRAAPLSALAAPPASARLGSGARRRSLIAARHAADAEAGAATQAGAAGAAAPGGLPADCSAVIIGGGPAGLAAALQLSSRGWTNVVVLEKRDSVKYADTDRSYVYNIDGRGRRLLERHGLGGGLEREGVSTEVVSLLRVYPDGKKEQRQQVIKDPTRATHWLPRPEFVGLLDDALKAQPHASRVRVITSASVDDVRRVGDDSDSSGTRSGGGVEVDVALPGGGRATLRPKLLLGCDGVGSRVREALEAWAAEDAGVRASGSFSAVSIPCPSAGLVFKVLQLPANPVLKDGTPLPNRAFALLQGRPCGALKGADAIRLGLLPFKGEGAPRTANLITKPGHPIWDVTDGEAMYSVLEDALPQADWRALVSPDAMARFAASRGGAFPAPTYSDGASAAVGGAAVVLLGDSLHCFPPDLGQGVNSALLDVLALDDVIAAASRQQQQPAAGTSPTATGSDAAKATVEGAEAAGPDAVDVSAFAAEYQRRQLPQAKALCALLPVGFPWQYFNSWHRKVWTAVFLMQSAVHKVAPFLMPPATFMMIQDSSLDYATILARVKQAQAVGRTILALLAAAALHTASRLLARAAAGGA